MQNKIQPLCRINYTNYLKLGNLLLVSKTNDLLRIFASKKNSYLGLLVLALFISSCSKEQLPGVSPYSPEKEFFEISFLKANNIILDKDYYATFEGNAITFELPKGINLSKLIPTFKISDKATLKIGNTVVESGKTEIDFTYTINFKVTAQNLTISDYNSNVLLVGLLPNLNINSNTSYNSYLKNNLYIDLSFAIPKTTLNKAYFEDAYNARAYGDFDKDGDLDIIAVARNTETNAGLEVEYYKNNTFQYQKDQSVFIGGVPKMVTGRKAIVGDFDGNGWLDVVIVGVGYDSSPFPGEGAVILFNTNGKFTSKDLGIGNGYFASITSGDVNNDGDLDLFVTNNQNISKFLINDGKGNFKYNADMYPNTYYNKGFFASEIYDINNDGYLDLITGGHEYNNTSTIILWGNATGNYMTSKSTTIQAVVGNGIIVDFDFLDYDKDGKTDILITRTGSGTGQSGYYEGYYLQLLKGNGTTSFTDITTTNLKNNANATAKWINWIRVQDVDNDGDLDITSDDKFYGLVWLNTNGVFLK